MCLHHVFSIFFLEKISPITFGQHCVYKDSRAVSTDEDKRTFGTLLYGSERWIKINEIVNKNQTASLSLYLSLSLYIYIYIYLNCHVCDS